jgi:hypothetical protein
MHNIMCSVFLQGQGLIIYVTYLLCNRTGGHIKDAEYPNPRYNEGVLYNDSFIAVTDGLLKC